VISERHFSRFCENSRHTLTGTHYEGVQHKGLQAESPDPTEIKQFASKSSFRSLGCLGKRNTKLQANDRSGAILTSAKESPPNSDMPQGSVRLLFCFNRE
jgi:hypothetical protein